MRTAFFTHCSDDWYEPVGCYKLEQSLKRLHPEIPFIRFGSAAIAEQRRLDPALHWDIMIPVWGRLLSTEFDLLIHFDADSLVAGRLDEVLEGDYDIAAVRNNDDFGVIRYSCPGVSPEVYLNCGLIAATRKEFWDEWDDANHREAAHMPLAEQDVFNRIAYSSRYRLKLLDPPGHHSYYGVAAHPRYWQDVRLHNDQLYLHGRQVRVLHQAGGHELPKLQITGQFQPDVARWLLIHTNSPCVRDAADCYRGLGHDLMVDAFLDRTHYVREVIQSIGSSRLRSRLRPMDVVLDIGAHMGIFSVFVSPLASRVIACEPSTEHQRALAKSIAHVGLKNVELCPCAVWTSSGERTFFLSDSNRTMHSLVKSPAHRGDSSLVPCITLSDLLASHNIHRVSLLKLDIEGGELPLLLEQSFADLASRIDSIWVECHSIAERRLAAEEVRDAIARRLAELGFSVDACDTEVFASRA